MCRDIRASDENIEKFLRKAIAGTAHNFDHFRVEHLKQLWSVFDSQSHDVFEFRASFLAVIDLLIHAQIPDEVKVIFRTFDIIALPKNDTDVRPIGLQMLLKKIAMSVVMSHKTMHNFNLNYFKHTQACLTPRGTENIAIYFDPSLHSFFFDMDNGFNKLNRSQCLWQVFTNIPSIFSLINMIYGKDAQAFVLAIDGFIDSIDSKEGVQQGDVMAMWLYTH